MKKQTLSISKNHSFTIPLGIGEEKPLPQKNLQVPLRLFVDGCNFRLPELRQSKSSSVVQKILALFSSREVRFGSLSHITKARQSLIDQLNRYIKKGKPIEITLLAVPFKTGNPLKVRHTHPDLGECAFLLRLGEICRLVEGTYAPGVRFIVLAEGKCLSGIMGVTRSEAIKYREEHKKLVRELGLKKCIVIKDLFDDVVVKIAGFEEKMQLNKVLIGRKFEGCDVQIVEQVRKTLPTIQSSLNRRNLATKEAAKLYINPDLPLQQEALDRTFAYLAFHKTRYDTLALEKSFPDALRATLTPRPGRLGIVPVNKETALFPHHGVGVIRKDKTITVMYEYDIRRMGNFKEVFLGNKLFCFEEV